MFDVLKGRRVFVTGATGLIGSALCRRLNAVGALVVALVRDAGKARARLPEGIELIYGDVAQSFPEPESIDYIVHAASNTASKAFVDSPVEVIEESVAGARNVLALARRRNVKGVVILSTMEVYGLTDSESVDEMGYAKLDTMSPRNCYPEVKRLVECLSASMAKEYRVPVRVARLTQTFGGGVAENDQRVFAQFARAVQRGEDIVLKSTGTTARCYCSVADAVSAIMTLLVKGQDGVAYNVANPETFCTIHEMAEMVARRFSGNRTKVVFDLSGAEASGYLPPFRMKLNVDRLRSLGWNPTQGLEEMYDELLSDWRTHGKTAL